MKKWNTPVIEALDICATAGGPVYSDQTDGNVWWNPENGQWERPFGVSCDASGLAGDGVNCGNPMCGNCNPPTP